MYLEWTTGRLCKEGYEELAIDLHSLFPDSDA